MVVRGRGLPARGAGVVVLGVVFGSTLVAGCSIEPRLEARIDVEKLERKLVEMMAERHVTAEATCPDDVRPKEGAEFTCQVVEADGTAHVARVAQTDGFGGMSIHVEGSFVDTQKVLADMKPKLGLGDAVVITCRKRVFVLKQPGDIAVCRAVEGGQEADVVIKLTDPPKVLVTVEPR